MDLEALEPRQSLLPEPSGVYGEELRFTGTVVVVDCCRGDGVSGMRPPAVRVENSPLWDLMGVDIAAVDIVKGNCDFFVVFPFSKNEERFMQSSDREASMDKM